MIKEKVGIGSNVVYLQAKQYNNKQNIQRKL